MSLLTVNNSTYLSELSQKPSMCLGMEVLAYFPSYLGGGDQEDHG
jgi:hypothetical protein